MRKVEGRFPRGYICGLHSGQRWGEVLENVRGHISLWVGRSYGAPALCTGALSRWTPSRRPCPRGRLGVSQRQLAWPSWWLAHGFVGRSPGLCAYVGVPRHVFGCGGIGSTGFKCILASVVFVALEMDRCLPDPHEIKGSKLECATVDKQVCLSGPRSSTMHLWWYCGPVGFTGFRWISLLPVSNSAGAMWGLRMQGAAYYIHTVSASRCDRRPASATLHR